MANSGAPSLETSNATPSATEFVAAEVLALAESRGLTIAAAESLTGGLLSSSLVAIPGASKVFLGSVVAYANDVKRSVLGVTAQTLQSNGAVSAQTAAQMAEGARRIIGDNASLGVATTGVAGPDLQDGQPVGRVYISIATKERTAVWECAFTGSREQIRQAAVLAALGFLRDEIQGHIGL